MSAYDELVGPFRAKLVHGKWGVAHELPCINGVSAWFTYCHCAEASEQESGYSDGALPAAEQRAKDIATALNARQSAEAKLEAVREALAPFATLNQCLVSGSDYDDDLLRCSVRAGDLRRAKEALASLDKEKAGG